ncbi:MAG: response regulator [Bacteroidota bacterium]|nr:response regulator [Bacteroidota bacterium]
MNRNALVVDDFKSIRLVVSNVLTKEGFIVTMAEDGLDALRFLDGKIKYDLIISDVDMPNIDGISLLKEIRKNPYYKDVPVVLLTTNTLERKQEEVQGLKIDAWIKKPFEFIKFKEIIKTLTQNK